MCWWGKGSDLAAAQKCHFFQMSGKKATKKKPSLADMDDWMNPTPKKLGSGESDNEIDYDSDAEVPGAFVHAHSHPH